ncbi:Pseudouridine-5'-phosphate glycosidase [Nymphaea thermarum]|nr:Pseudouridine-5'-phosphate glycosidase [Nymphaea thermarum]
MHLENGMPYPQNLETALKVEKIVMDNGSVPATIAILNGVPCIGLSREELELLARLGTKVRKTARRDIPYIEIMGQQTVSATMFFAAKVGIPVFVTGGTGGVHRHGESTLDISSDLTELGRTSVAVVSAGFKSTLDILRTLEYVAPFRVDTPEACARLIDENKKLGMGSGILIGVPIPEAHAASGTLIELAIRRALEEARDKNIVGNAATPFLLGRVNELTGGASLAAVRSVSKVTSIFVL